MGCKFNSEMQHGCECRGKGEYRQGMADFHSPFEEDASGFTTDSKITWRLRISDLINN
jgi:hypothetical protein